MKQKDRQIILQECLELLRAEGETPASVLARYAEHKDWLKPELETTWWLVQQRQAFAPRPDFITASRRRLAPRLEQALPVHPWISRLRGLLWMRANKLAVYAVLIVLLAVQLINGARVVLAYRAWLPGDALYPIITSTEKITLLFSFSTARRASLHIEYTKRRLMEVQALICESDYAMLPSAVSQLDEHVNQALHALDQMAWHDPAQARLLAIDLQAVLVTQSQLAEILAGFTPLASQAEFERVKSIARNGILSVQYILSPNGGESGRGKVVWQELLAHGSVFPFPRSTARQFLSSGSRLSNLQGMRWKRNGDAPAPFSDSKGRVVLNNGRIFYSFHLA